MWQVMCECLTGMLAAGCCALAVKLLDDHLDRERDLSCSRPNLANQLGTGSIIYATLLLAIAASLESQLSLGLFFASYCIGMFNDLNRLMPTRLKGWQESGMVFAFGLWLLGWRIMLFAFVFTLAVQLLDDCLDRKTDRLCGQRNLACRLGVVECLLSGLTLLLFAWWLDGRLFLATFWGVGIVYFGILRLQGVKLWLSSRSY